jgi:chromate reductase
MAFSLRKPSFNTALMRSLPVLAPIVLDLSGAPPYDRMPLYNAVIQSAGFPADVITFADAIRNGDGVIIVSPEHNWTIPGGLKNALDWLLRLENQPFGDKPVAIQSSTGGRPAALACNTTCGWHSLTQPSSERRKCSSGLLKDEPTKKVIADQLAAFTAGRWPGHGSCTARLAVAARCG